MSRSKKATAREVQSMMVRYDADLDGALNCQEFVNMCMENQEHFKLNLLLDCLRSVFTGSCVKLL
jgi:hypothetical protein